MDKKDIDEDYLYEGCSKDMTFDECQLVILRNAVDKAEKIKENIILTDDLKQIISIVEKFIISKKLICYGGSAINNILPKNEQFYNRDVNIPDYDFYSANALNDAKELADIYYKNGYENVEAKSAIHYGTFKVFVNYIPIADITQIPKILFKQLLKDSIPINGILYAPANFLRMNLFIELSRPSGDVSRWEKLLKRLVLLNKHYPFIPDKKCSTIKFQRKLTKKIKNSDKLYTLTRDTLIDSEVVFFGGYALSLYGQYLNKSYKKIVNKIPDFDVLSNDPNKTAMILSKILVSNGFENIKIIKHPNIGEIIPYHVEVRVDEDTIVFIYKPIACHSYNKIELSKGKEIMIASIDTILSFYLAFYYINKPYYDKLRLLCMASFLFEVEEKNKLKQNGLLKRFSLDCYGKQETINDIRELRSKKYKQLKHDKNKKQYNLWFLKYYPAEPYKTKYTKNNNTTKKNHKRYHKRNKSKKFFWF